MKAEDYLRAREQENKRFFGSEGLNIGEAYQAVNMAREEDRKKAICFFEEVLNKCDGCKDSMSAKCGKDCLIRRLKELVSFRV